MLRMLLIANIFIQLFFICIMYLLSLPSFLLYCFYQ